MSNAKKQLSSPFSTGGGGGHFEAHVQASFVALMLAGGYAPCLPCLPISKIKLQGKFAGFQTDDLIVFVQDSTGRAQCKLLGQVKHSITISENDTTFAEVIHSAWLDYNNPDVFNKEKDVFALITGPLSMADVNDVRVILEWARTSEDADEFFQKVELWNFSSEVKRRKLQAFKSNLRKANDGSEVPDDLVFDFLKRFHLLGYDLDIKAGVTLALLHSLIGQYSPDSVQPIWARLVEEVQSANKNAGTISKANIPEDILSAFQQRRVEIIPAELVALHPEQKITTFGDKPQQIAALTAAALVGKWNETNEPDIKIIKRLLNGF